MLGDFTLSKQNDVFIITVNSLRAHRYDAHEFTNLLASIIKTPNLKLIIDLSICEFIDSTFLGAIIMANKIVLANEGKIKLIITKDGVKKIFEDMRLDRLFPVANNLKESLHNFK
jgi:anti-anti-sigma factor